MTVPASKVRSCCTPAEVALVRASRKGQLEKLSHAELKRHVLRARTLFDKWRDLGRSQSRARSRKVGFGDVDANTDLKAQIFRDALESFEAQLAKVESTASAAKGPKPKLKKQRTAEHRSTRAAVRKGMTAVEDLINAQGSRKKKTTTNPALTAASQAKAAPAATEPAKSAAAARVPSKPTPKSRSLAKVAPPAKRAGKVAGFDASKQRDVISSAKKSRIVRSGATTRMAGHIAARGKRAQARRDSNG